MRSGLPALTRPFSACRIKTFFGKPQTGAISGKVHVFKGLNPNRAENKAKEEVYRPRGSKQKPRITQLRRELLLYNKISSGSFGLHEKMFSMLETRGATQNLAQTRKGKNTIGKEKRLLARISVKVCKCEGKNASILQKAH